MKSTELDGKVALVTGVSNGIGAAVSRRLASLGATLVAADVDDAPGSPWPPRSRLLRPLRRPPDPEENEAVVARPSSSTAASTSSTSTPG